jgi:hypothetical protein
VALDRNDATVPSGRVAPPGRQRPRPSATRHTSTEAYGDPHAPTDVQKLVYVQHAPMRLDRVRLVYADC